MKSAVCSLESVSAYSQSRNYTESVPKKEKETADSYETRTWRNKCHSTKDGHIEIPGIVFANCIKASARRLKLQIPGKGRTEYTKYFEAGIMVPDALVLPTKVDEVPFDRLHVSATGKPGYVASAGGRVWRNFPRVDSWSGSVTFYVLDETITEEIFLQVLQAAGQLVGIGRFRPENRGYYGRFIVKSVRWLDETETLKRMGSAA